MQAVALLLISFLFSTTAWGQWRTNQRSHELSRLPLNSTFRLCRDFMDPDGFQRILSPLLVPRVVGTVQHRQVGQYIKNFFDLLGWTTEWDIFQDNTPLGKRIFRNLIVTYEVNAPRRLVLACHYDSKILPGSISIWEKSDCFYRQVMIGATDSAVPCAMMMDIAKSLTPYLYGRAAADVALQLIFFDGEEAFVEWSESDSTYGSRHLASKWEKTWYPSTTGANFELSKEIDRIDVLILLDLLGARNPTISNSVGMGADRLYSHLPSIEQNLRKIGCIGAVPNVFQAVISRNAVEDDHIPFLKRGVPILHLITVPFPRVWHTAFDNKDALHYPTIYHLTSILRVFVAQYLGVAPL
ncbi:peptidase, M28 family [Dictyocaulus viviparus]|uniref:Glutaminyl-peptide cyclotransferase n=1 Tax=Dictyocaulus viviparus TaxID=29172 RepID=A0A0D8YBI5_DICVI|nr:peptidase, M28 family [Dictyocaulus viviparus]